MTKNFEIVYRNPAELIPYEMNAKNMTNSRSTTWRLPSKSAVLTSRSRSTSTTSSLLVTVVARRHFWLVWSVCLSSFATI